MVRKNIPRLCRYCSRCKKKFQPTGKYEKLCMKCKESWHEKKYG